MSENYRSKSTWGPLFWQLGHLVSFAYPEGKISPEQREQTARFYESLSSVLPCSECKTDYAAILARDPVRPHLSNRDTLSRWFYNVHNQVNIKLNKPITLSYDEVRARYLSCQNQEQEVKTCKKNLGGSRFLIIILAIALVVLIAYLLVAKKRQ